MHGVYKSTAVRLQQSFVPTLPDADFQVLAAPPTTPQHEEKGHWTGGTIGTCRMRPSLNFASQNSIGLKFSLYISRLPPLLSALNLHPLQPPTTHRPPFQHRNCR